MEPHREIQFTYREYALLPDDGRRHELIEGDFYVSPSPTTRHQRVLRNLTLALIAQLGKAAEVLFAPLDVILADTTVVQPDIVALRPDRKQMVSLRGIEGPPNLVIEILSPSTKGNDVFLKRGVYARYAVPEYWLVDCDRQEITVLRAEQAGAGYTLVARFERASTLTSVEFPELAISLGPVLQEEP